MEQTKFICLTGKTLSTNIYGKCLRFLFVLDKFQIINLFKFGCVGY